ncbi:sel1 repeat family protein [Stenotrophomonas sp. ZAC14D1_NAIMI4_6]|uniref:tetratricopeptide repeat protein n=1 Tax=Stenotrophomonas maltophilia group TaxID=995085 RepID=UPI0009A1FE19|nr:MULTISPECIES: SEL1-like repeat protein [Stenotrophomonas maltophilia group]AWH38410.1 sel1 repeat family protein [Stenotrophomonas sp. ZAC14D1_NAIMI4_6]AWH42541.1 sel1 repeat family protein [Stenotrophomonas sp. ZAC14D1_NAIMI4_1]
MTGLPTDLSKEANRLLDLGRTDDLAALVRDALKSGSAESIFLSSCYGSTGESEEDFNARSLSQSMLAAEMGYAPAQFRLGQYFLFGDFVEMDAGRAEQYFKSAAESGYPPAMYEYGLALRNGVPAGESCAEAMSWIARAAEAGDELAAEYMASMDD